MRWDGKNKVGGEERCGREEQAHDIVLYQGIGLFLISILGKFNLINNSTLHSVDTMKQAKVYV